MARSKVEGEQSSGPVEGEDQTSNKFAKHSDVKWNFTPSNILFPNNFFSFFLLLWQQQNGEKFFETGWRDGDSASSQSRRHFFLINSLRLLKVKCCCGGAFGVDAARRAAWLTFPSVDSRKYFSHRKVFNNSNSDGFCNLLVFFLSFPSRGTYFPLITARLFSQHSVNTLIGDGSLSITHNWRRAGVRFIRHERCEWWMAEGNQMNRTQWGRLSRPILSLDTFFISRLVAFFFIAHGKLSTCFLRLRSY